MMKNIYLLMITIVFFSGCAVKEPKLQFRLVCQNGETSNIQNNVYNFFDEYNRENEKLYLQKNIILSEEDIDEIKIYKINENKFRFSPIILLKFKNEEKLEQASRDNLKNKIAILYNNKILMVPTIMQPITSGSIQLFAPTKFKSNQDAVSFVKNIGFIPTLED